VPRPTLGPTQPPVQRVPGVLFRDKARPERDADHSTPSSAKVKNDLLGTFSLPCKAVSGRLYLLLPFNFTICSFFGTN
jgi:hypothetical protein